jgi:5-(carboxyamino)imidazole ribonucleotide synthase
VIPPGGTLGLLGGGQLGRMFAGEAARLGYRVLVVDPDPHAPAARLASEHLAKAWTDPAVIDVLARHAAAVTTEFENVPADVLRALASHLPVRPGADAVATCQDRIAEKSFLRGAGVPTVSWAAVGGPGDLDHAWRAIGAQPGLLKTARLGYDGKGQVAVGTRTDLETAFASLGGTAAILERRVQLAVELSVMVARGPDGAVATWPIGENVHRNGILHTTVVPARVDEALAAAARDMAIRVAMALDYVGVLGVECFVTTDGELLVNEMAPRPHNSGHWTLDASVTSQFEQQARTLAGLPLGDTRALSAAAMVNIVGDCWTDGPPHFERALAMPGVRLHLYGKREPRPGRKMGHLTALADTAGAALGLALAAWQALGRPPSPSPE